MNAIDQEMLLKQYQSVNNAYEHAVISMLDVAYQAGLERGQGNINKVIAVFEKMTVAIDKWMTGDLMGIDAIDAITDAYEEMDALNKELQQ